MHSRLYAPVDQRVRFIMSNAPALYDSVGELKRILRDLKVSKDDLAREIEKDTWYDTNAWWDNEDVVEAVKSIIGGDLVIKVKNNGIVTLKNL